MMKNMFAKIVLKDISRIKQGNVKNVMNIISKESMIINVFNAVML
jgi:hypothetical protein